MVTTTNKRHINQPKMSFAAERLQYNEIPMRISYDTFDSPTPKQIVLVYRVNSMCVGLTVSS